MKRYYSVAIDGPSGAGKSSVAKVCAERFHFLYVDTGAIYRTVGLAALRSSIDTHDADAVVAMLPLLKIDLRYGEDGLQRMVLNGEDVTDSLRCPEVSLAASAVSAIPAVRAFLMDMQRNLAKNHSVIMDGRDIGTVVLPSAGLKIFLTASPEARAQRRMMELQKKGQAVSFEEVFRDLMLRDKNDTTRETCPLKQAEDSILLDTSQLDFDQSCDAVANLIKEHFSL